MPASTHKNHRIKTVPSDRSKLATIDPSASNSHPLKPCFVGAISHNPSHKHHQHRYQRRLMPIDISRMHSQVKAREKSQPSSETMDRVHNFSMVRNQQLLQTLDMSSPNITTKSWCLYDRNRKKMLGFRSDYRRQVASLTKIMTVFLAIQLSSSHQLSLNCLVRITNKAASLIGTTANLKQRRWITIQDLLFGAMLPSGNDAAYSIAEYVGYHIYTVANSQLDEDKDSKELDSPKCMDLTAQNTNIYVQVFIKLMNDRATQLGLTGTRFSNPHGLQNAFNTSSAKDMVRLSVQVSKNTIFRSIMNTIQYNYRTFECKDARKKETACWWNTNQLLHQDWQGVKTGQTVSAGSCLASLKQGVYIVVLNCQDGQARFSDTQRIYEWYRGSQRDSSKLQLPSLSETRLHKQQNLMTRDSFQ